MRGGGGGASCVAGNMWLRCAWLEPRTISPPPPSADGWQTGGMHPTGMLTCYVITLSFYQSDMDNVTIQAVFLYIILVPVHRYNGTI